MVTQPRDKKTLEERLHDVIFRCNWDCYDYHHI